MASLLLADMLEAAPFLCRYWQVLVSLCLAALVSYAVKTLQANTRAANLKQGIPKSNLSRYERARDLDPSRSNLEEDEEQEEEKQCEEMDNAQINHIAYGRATLSEDEMLRRSREFYELMQKRRTLRFFSDKVVPLEVIQNIIHTADYSISLWFKF
ncbi:PREDICTED: iodotyrosine deiodinase 1-like [Priapulus caudatus]|uniref:Iodotyrosine deiodinase 1-like n=1 Tax=Priapulus caudatus TaxID=37621 RepID=A0ABM1DQJ2_PRICU|nr:PREDICTED: iodotyrosine deiodinase 1-like [Priapulus caudatus]